jgi:hypothetical protein
MIAYWMLLDVIVEFVDIRPVWVLVVTQLRSLLQESFREAFLCNVNSDIGITMASARKNVLVC